MKKRKSNANPNFGGGAEYFFLNINSTDKFNKPFKMWILKPYL